MNQIQLRESISSLASFAFARSGGPGGQNVNKVNSKVILSIHIDSLEGLSFDEKARIKERLEYKISTEGLFTVTCEEERSQHRNREIALLKTENLLISAAKPQKRRIPTKPGKAAKLRRLSEKKHRSKNLASRKAPSTDD